jgi:hypothetical protein
VGEKKPVSPCSFRRFGALLSGLAGVAALVALGLTLATGRLRNAPTRQPDGTSAGSGSW